MAEVIEGRLVLGVDELSPMGRAAVEYASDGIAVVPLVPNRKEPLTKHGLNDWSVGVEQIRWWWTRAKEANVGGVLGRVSGGIIAIDLDVHDEGHSGIEFLRGWQVENGELPETWTQVTGSGGKQLFYRVNREIRNSANGSIGVDIRGDGGYVVLPPSIHPNGERYEWSVSPEDMDVADADEVVYAFIDAVRPTPAAGGGAHERFELPEVISQNRNDTLYRYGSSLRSRGMSEGEIDMLMRAANQSRCKPPMDDAEMAKLVASACRHRRGDGLRRTKGERGGDVVDVDADAPTYRENYDPKLTGYLPRRGKDGEVEPLRGETVGKLQGLVLAHAGLRDGIKFNVLDQKLWLLRGCVPGSKFDQPHVMTDGEQLQLMTYFEREFGVRSKAKFLDALQSLSAVDGQSFNPIKEQLGTLPLVRPLCDSTIACGEGNVLVSEDQGETWQERPRMAGALFMKYLNCDWSSEYTATVEGVALRQLVARAMYPGCKADYMVVFHGAQGIGKSTFVGKLALSESFLLLGFNEFGTEDLKRIASKLVVEIPELDGFGSRDMNRIKSVITTVSDNYRESYAKTPTDHPRTAVFFGTTNDLTFLTDATGNRRFLPVECGAYVPRRGEAVDGDANPALFTGECERDVRQAWAETVALLNEVGEDAFMRSLVLPRRMASEAHARQAEHTIEDPITGMVEDYMEGLSRRADAEGAAVRVNVKRVMFEAMGYDELRYSSEKAYMIQRVTSAIERVEGWRRMDGKQRVPGFGKSKAWTYGTRG